MTHNLRLKKNIYSLFIFLIIASPIYFFSSKTISSMNEITGFAIKEDNNHNNNADSFKYSIYPHFKVMPEHNLSAYDKIKISSAKLIKEALECENLAELETCITQKMDRKHWKINCLKDEELAFANIASQYALCQESDDKFCYCEISLDEGEYDITIENNTFDMGELKTRFPISAAVDILGNGVLSFADKEPFHLISEKGGNKQTLKIGENNIEYDKTMIIYKNKETMVFVPKKTINAHECFIPNKRKYVFCADYNETVYTKEKTQELIYKFALDFTDDTIPKQTMFDIKEKTGKIIIDITPSTEPDIDHYNIYCSAQPFSNIKDMSPTIRIKDTKTQLSGYFEDGEYIVFKQDTDYYVSVVPVDKSNNHVMDVVTKSVQMQKVEYSQE